MGWSLKNGVDRVLTFRWKERGTRLPERPKRKGFGTVLIAATLGATRFDHQSDGLLYEVDVHIAGNGVADPHDRRSGSAADFAAALPATLGSNLIH